MQLAYGGGPSTTPPPQGDADLIGLLAAVVILLLAFGSVVAMGLPIVTALFGLGVGIALIHAIASATDIGTLAPTLGTMIGLGVGIDYSLLIVTRYRENVANGMSIEKPPAAPSPPRAKRSCSPAARSSSLSAASRCRAFPTSRGSVTWRASSSR